MRLQPKVFGYLSVILEKLNRKINFKFGKYITEELKSMCYINGERYEIREMRENKAKMI